VAIVALVCVVATIGYRYDWPTWVVYTAVGLLAIPVAEFAYRLGRRR